MRSIFLLSFLILFSSCSFVGGEREVASNVVPESSSCINLVERIFAYKMNRKALGKLQRIQELKAEMQMIQVGIGFFRKGKGEQNLFEIAKKQNEFVQHLKRFFDSVGEQSRIIHRKYTDKKTGQVVTYFALDLGEIDQKKSKALKRFRRFQGALDVDRVEIDLFGNSIIGAGGRYNQRDRVLYLSSNSVFSLLDYDQIDFVFSHEMAHAMFESKRLKGLDSLYHPSVMALSEKRHLMEGSIYDRFLSTEELYNYINGPYWITQRDISDFSARGIERQIALLQDAFTQIKGITAAIKNTSETVLGIIKEQDPLQLGRLGEHWGFASEVDPRRIVIVMDDDLMIRHYTLHGDELKKTIGDLNAIIEKYDIPDDLNIFTDVKWKEKITEIEDMTAIELHMTKLAELKVNIEKEVIEKFTGLQAMAEHYSQPPATLVAEANNFLKMFNTKVAFEAAIGPGQNQEIREAYQRVNRAAKAYSLASREGTPEFKDVLGL